MAETENMKGMFDASIPPIQHPPDTKVVQVAGGYIGGNTPHVWTDQEWDQIPQPLRLPIYTCSHPELHDPNVEAANAVRWLDDHNVPTDVWVALDLETAVNPLFVRAFDAKIVASGRLLTIYGSKSTIFENPLTSGGYWVADWTGQPHLVSRSVITQYASDTMLNLGYDLNVVDDSVRFWRAPMALTSEEHDWLKADHETLWNETPGSGSILERVSNTDEIYATVQDIQTRLAVVEAAVQSGIPVNLTDVQLDTLAAKFAEKLAANNLKLSGTLSMNGTIILGADA